LSSVNIKEIKKGSVFIENKNTKNFTASSIIRFKINIQNIGLAPYSASNPAPVGARIIGVNNFIG